MTVIQSVLMKYAAVTKDSNHDYSDYIELYNASDEEISLLGWYLSDDKNELKKVQLPDIQLHQTNFLYFMRMEMMRTRILFHLR